MSQMRTIIRDLELPSYSILDPITNKATIHHWKLPSTYHVMWPNGHACHEANMYLVDIAPTLTIRRHDGGTLNSISSNLIHLIRYCWDHEKNFEDLTGDDFYAFVKKLIDERSIKDPSQRVRNNNTVNLIIDRSIHFLIWLQDHFIFDHVIVGTADKGSNIRLKEKSFINHFGQKQTKLAYAYAPPRDIQDPKRPMPVAIRNRLCEAVGTLAEQDISRIESQASKAKKLSIAEIKYLTKRRQLLLRLLEATGCRPGELADMSVSKNNQCIKTNRLILPTLKRRKLANPERSVPTDIGTAIKLYAFIKQREAYLKLLKANGTVINPGDRIFISSKKGTPVSPRTLNSEFSKIRRIADVPNQRACMSMFRHRFITNMVKIHLKKFLQNNPAKNKCTIENADYRTILRRVATFTGHGSETSLFPYIDWAWEEMGIFNYVDAAINLQQDIMGIRSDIESLKLDIKLNESLTKSQIMNTIENALCEMTDRLDKSLLQNTKVNG